VVLVWFLCGPCVVLVWDGRLSTLPAGRVGLEPLLALKVGRSMF